MSDVGASEPVETDYQRVERSEEFQSLRKAFRNFVFPMTALFLVWYLLYALMSTYAHEFMSIRLGDSNFTVGLLFGLLQFLSTFVITTLYARWANNKFDARAQALREEIEEGQL